MNIISSSLAFVEGLALIASPCILPVLPLVLGASVDGGKKRPFGIIIGFVLAFSLITFASRKIVLLFGINEEIIQKSSLVLLTVFGIILLSNKLSEKFAGLTQGAANFGSSYSMNNEGGLLSGIAIGSLIGLIWTPCAGPILAAVLVQAIREGSDAESLLVIIPFAMGAGLPMLIISLTGRKIMGKLGFFTKHAHNVRKAIGMVMLLAVISIASGVDAQTFFGTSSKQVENGEALQLQEALQEPYIAPEFAGIEQWMNSKPLTMESLKGKVVLVDFWTYSCINCVRTLPYIVQWDKKYRDAGLVIIGIHAPEFEFEKNPKNVKAALAKHGIAYPVALDNHLSTWTNFKNQYWPAHYLIDKSGKVVYTHFGEGNYAQTENNIRYLLDVKDKAEATPEAATSIEGQTPETYLGAARAKNFIDKNKSELERGEQSFSFPEFLPIHNWALQGGWKVEGEYISAAKKDSALRLNFYAKKIFLVMGNATEKPITATIWLNGKAVTEIIVNQNTLYELANQTTAQNSLLEITASDAGLELYAFTFGE